MGASPPMTFGPGPIATWQQKQLTPPSSLYLPPQSFLVVQVANSVAGFQLGVQYRILTIDDGLIKPGQEIRTPTTNRVFNGFIFPLSEGFLLGLTLSVFSAGAV